MDIRMRLEKTKESNVNIFTTMKNRIACTTKAISLQELFISYIYLWREQDFSLLTFSSKISSNMPVFKKISPYRNFQKFPPV